MHILTLIGRSFGMRRQATFPNSAGKFLRSLERSFPVPNPTGAPGPDSASRRLLSLMCACSDKLAARISRAPGILGGRKIGKPQQAEDRQNVKQASLRALARRPICSSALAINPTESPVAMLKSEWHGQNGQERWDYGDRVRPRDFGGVAHHQGSDQDKRGRGGAGRDNAMAMALSGKASRNRTPVTIAVTPLRPPAATPAALST